MHKNENQLIKANYFLPTALCAKYKKYNVSKGVKNKNL